ncbi:hypothetical protein KFL_002440060 [Klebsormidium nitens]|uniref:PhoD-like phosphatase metallophosphatase domain-containing protein n=1 Tax=Klebsormidium nitens TaxID=105231 RepID=A0A1Y1I3T4_KLENI|nr:hypothetical protein KFL_002440060 [Klebsormidium nitens]|eukprot:GAQ85600.1 hypothetical protein KFL_002440060 [Klebsormidium nitens]
MAAPGGFLSGQAEAPSAGVVIPDQEEHSASGSWKADLKGKMRSLKNALKSAGLGRTHSAQSKDIPDPADVIVGPVIGKVTDCTARILIELDKTAQVTLALVDEISGILAGSKVLAVPPFQPTIFTFQGLKPETSYSVQIRGCHCGITSGFKTIAQCANEVKFAVISCNKIFITRTEVKTGTGDLWHHLEKRIAKGQVDMMLHLGDQVYADGDKAFDKAAAREHTSLSNKFAVAEDMLKGIPWEQWPQYYDRICAIYREIYRETWAHPPTARCLATCPSIMIYDDHEVRDNWGDLPTDWDPASLHMFVARCAWRVQLEYQRQLHEDVDFAHLERITRDFHFHVVGGVGLMFLDIRGSRTFHRRPNDPYKYLGSDQWTEIKSALGRGGIFDGVRALLVCSPAPVVFLTGLVTDEFADHIARLEDFKGHWSHRDHRGEQLEFLTRLVEWKGRVAAGAGGRELYIFGGDVHCGGHSDILLGDQLVFRQLTSSAIANHPLPTTAYTVLRLAGDTLEDLGENFSFHHHHWTRRRNYGLVSVVNQNQGDPAAEVKITTQLVDGHAVMTHEGPIVSSCDEKVTDWNILGRCIRSIKGKLVLR